LQTMTVVQWVKYQRHSWNITNIHELSFNLESILHNLIPVKIVLNEFIKKKYKLTINVIKWKKKKKKKKKKKFLFKKKNK
jgi:hypothetical protein